MIAPEVAQPASCRAFERLERGDRGALHKDALEPVGDLPSRRRRSGSSPAFEGDAPPYVELDRACHVRDGAVLVGVVGAA